MTEQGKVINVEETVPGYAHTRFTGTYSGPVTPEDIIKRFESPFGGRDLRFGNGRFSYIRHDD